MQLCGSAVVKLVFGACFCKRLWTLLIASQTCFHADSVSGVKADALTVHFDTENCYLCYLSL